MVVCSLIFSVGLSKPSIGLTQASGTEQQYQMTYTITFLLTDLTFNTQTGYDTIRLKDGVYTTDIGKPMLPLKNIKVALPENMKATSVHLVDVQEQIIDGQYLLYPAQPAQKIGTPLQDIPFIPPDTTTYQSPQIIPAPYIELINQNDLAGQSMADLTVYPVRYLPAERKVYLVTSMTFTLEGTSGYICGDYLPKSFSPTNYALYQHIIQNEVINPNDVLLHTSNAPQHLGVDPGNYQYVIITQESWVSDFQPLAEWKTKKGVPATIVTTNWIYNDGGYSGTNVNKIKAFAEDVYTNWGTIYVLLGGDTDIVPCHYASFSPGVVADDTYYADFDADWVCEVNVGRASVTGPGTDTGQIGTFIDKVVNYETNPPLTDFATKAGLFGFNLDWSTPGEQCKEVINSSYIPMDWTVTTVYDSYPGNHLTDVITALNAGQNLLNHADHGNTDFMGTGYVNHGWGIYSSDMDELRNGDKQGIIYSWACDTTYYDYSTACIAEHYVRNSNGGGLGFIGNSRYGWFYSGSLDTLSSLYDTYFFRSVFEKALYNLGVAFSAHKDDGYSNDDYMKYIYTELTLLGDPELPIWTADPMVLNASFPSHIPVGASSFPVIVTSDGASVDQAYVCLWKGDEVYQTGYTDSAGVLTVSVSPSTQGSMFVTITKHNYLPFQGSTLISNNQPPNTPTITGPSKGKIKIPTKYNFTTTDPENDTVSYFIDWGDGTNSSWIGPYTSGNLISKSHTWTKKGDYTIKAKAKDIYGNESGWGTLKITMPRSYSIPFNPFLERLFERFPHRFPILRHLLGY